MLPSAVLFDMDGTLTEPRIDFARLKAELGIGDQPILEAMARMPPARLPAAQAILDRHEDEAARLSTLNVGCRQLLSLLEAAGVATALITRNSLSSVRTVLAVHGLPIDVLISRHCAPPKPSPEPLFEACRRLKVDPQSAWMVGDGEFDVQAGINAGCRTVWLSHRRSRHFPETPWRTVADLPELARLIESCQAG